MEILIQNGKNKLWKRELMERKEGGGGKIKSVSFEICETVSSFV